MSAFYLTTKFVFLSVAVPLTNSLVCADQFPLFISSFLFSTLLLLLGQQERCPAVKRLDP